jgi:F-type H+-transporting ATPase subunit epsilon
MADTFKLEVATPAALVVDEDVTMAEIPGGQGYLGILPGHAPLLGTLAPGVLSYEAGGQTHVLAVDSGFIEVLDNVVSVLTESAQRSKDIKIDEARQQLSEAERALTAPPRDGTDYDALLLAVSRAQARVDAAGK